MVEDTAVLGIIFFVVCRLVVVDIGFAVDGFVGFVDNVLTVVLVVDTDVEGNVVVEVDLTLEVLVEEIVENVVDV